MPGGVAPDDGRRPTPRSRPREEDCERTRERPSAVATRATSPHRWESSRAQTNLKYPGPVTPEQSAHVAESAQYPQCSSKQVSAFRPMEPARRPPGDTQD